jgi:hypothetical protein
VKPGRFIQALVSLVLIQSPNASRDVLEEFFADTALPLDFAIRSIVGLDPEAVAARFAEFARRHPSITAKQTRFLALLQNHIARFGSRWIASMSSRSQWSTLTAWMVSSKNRRRSTIFSTSSASSRRPWQPARAQKNPQKGRGTK